MNADRSAARARASNSADLCNCFSLRNSRQRTPRGTAWTAVEKCRRIFFPPCPFHDHPSRFDRASKADPTEAPGRLGRPPARGAERTPAARSPRHPRVLLLGRRRPAAAALAVGTSRERLEPPPGAARQLSRRAGRRGCLGKREPAGARPEWPPRPRRAPPRQVDRQPCAPHSYLIRALQPPL
ncbi:Zinc Finger Protein 40 [Manis pentadactyla]|nr:Zinc Finger Protein 40 [Manis pentadactyla]